VIKVYFIQAESFNWQEPGVTLGAVILGGLVTYFTTYCFERRKENQNRLVLAHRLIFNVRKMCEEIGQLNLHVEECIRRAKGNTYMLEGAEISELLGLSSSEIHLSAEELALVATKNNSDMLMDILSIQTDHQIVFQAYRKIIDLKSLLPANITASLASGNTATYIITKEELAALSHILIPLQTSSSFLKERLPEIIRDAKIKAVKLSPFLKSTYKFAHLINLTFVEHE
jgi:hypothetical protein